MIAFDRIHTPALAAIGLAAGVVLSLAAPSSLVFGAAGALAAGGAGLLFHQIRDERRRADHLTRDTARLHRLLSAAPCCWDDEGGVMMSPAFARLLDNGPLDRMDDVAGALDPEHADSFITALDRLRREGVAFELEAGLRDGRRMRLAGRRDSPTAPAVLWLEDVTARSRTADAERAVHRRTETTLDELRAALDALPTPVWMRGPDLRLTWCNQAYARAVDAGCDLAVAEQRELAAALSHALAKDARRDGAPRSCRITAVIGTERRLLEVTETPRGHGMTAGMVVGFALDLTPVEELQGALRRHQTAHAEVLERLGSAIAIFGADTRLTFFNQAFAGMWDLDEGWLRGEPTHGELLEELRSRRKLPEYADFQGFKRDRLAHYTKLMEAAEELMHLPDGTTLRVLASPHPLGGLILIMEDVTNTLALESSYNTLIAVQQETLDNLAEGIAVFGGDGRLKLSNPAFARIWDLQEDELLGEPHITEVFERMRPFFIHPETADGFPPEDGMDDEGWDGLKDEMVGATLERAVRSGRLERTDGSVVEFSTLPLPDGAVLNSYLDVTDGARLEQALRASNAALEAADQLKTEFIANVSHHLRTPLNGIIGFAEVLGNQYFGPLTERQQEYVKGVLSAGERMLELIDDIVDLTSIGTGVTTLDRGTVDVPELIESVAGLTREWARREGLRLEVQAPRGLGSFEGDAKRLKQALFNLVVAAIRTPPPEGRILLSAERTSHALLFGVGDATLPPPGRTSTGGDGTGQGLGLALVRNVIELHGGRLLIDGEPGHGNRVRCVLPIGPRSQG